MSDPVWQKMVLGLVHSVPTGCGSIQRNGGGGGGSDWINPVSIANDSASLVCCQLYLLGTCILQVVCDIFFFLLCT